MTRFPTPPPEPALKAFLDEVVIPLLVARFLREHAAAATGGERRERSVSLTNDCGTGTAGSTPARMPL
jgi:hypothetical protein